MSVGQSLNVVKIVFVALQSYVRTFQCTHCSAATCWATESYRNQQGGSLLSFKKSPLLRQSPASSTLFHSFDSSLKNIYLQNVLSPLWYFVQRLAPQRPLVERTTIDWHLQSAPVMVPPDQELLGSILTDMNILFTRICCSMVFGTIIWKKPCVCFMMM